jgi:hypothetical protein
MSTAHVSVHDSQFDSDNTMCLTLRWSEREYFYPEKNPEDNFTTLSAKGSNALSQFSKHSGKLTVGPSQSPNKSPNNVKLPMTL